MTLLVYYMYLPFNKYSWNYLTSGIHVSFCRAHIVFYSLTRILDDTRCFMSPSIQSIPFTNVNKIYIIAQAFNLQEDLFTQQCDFIFLIIYLCCTLGDTVPKLSRPGYVLARPNLPT